MWCNFKFEGVLFRSVSTYNDVIVYGDVSQCRQSRQWLSGIETKLLGGLWFLAKTMLKMDSCLSGAILNLTAFCSIWTHIEECSSIDTYWSSEKQHCCLKQLLIEIYFKNFILQVFAYVEELQSNEKSHREEQIDIETDTGRVLWFIILIQY